MDISQITDYLYVGAEPDAARAEELLALGVRLVISMRGEKRPPAVFGQPPLSLLWLRTYDTIFTPIRVRTLAQGVRAALPVIETGGRVLIHCQRGRHRSAAMAAAVLIARGQSARGAMRLLRERRQLADPYIWYIRRQIEKFEKHWRNHPSPLPPTPPPLPAGEGEG